jgi:hypothetical protein
MRLLRQSETGEFSLTEYSVEDRIPHYAILSHTWIDSQEVTYKDLMDGTGKGKSGFKKIQFCGQRAELDGLQYFWVDICCIDKSNKAEVQKAINSMFCWYRNATRCYVYLSDVCSPPNSNDKCNPPAWESDFQKSKCFTWGWTLQELLAPTSVKFFSRECKKLGNKCSLKQQIYETTNIPHSAGPRVLACARGTFPPAFQPRRVARARQRPKPRQDRHGPGRDAAAAAAASPGRRAGGAEASKPGSPAPRRAAAARTRCAASSVRCRTAAGAASGGGGGELGVVRVLVPPSAGREVGVLVRSMGPCGFAWGLAEWDLARLTGLLLWGWCSWERA